MPCPSQKCSSDPMSDAEGRRGGSNQSGTGDSSCVFQAALTPATTQATRVALGAAVAGLAVCGVTSAASGAAASGAVGAPSAVLSTVQFLPYLAQLQVHPTARSPGVRTTGPECPHCPVGCH